MCARCEVTHGNTAPAPKESLTSEKVAKASEEAGTLMSKLIDVSTWQGESRNIDGQCTERNKVE